MTQAGTGGKCPVVHGATTAAGKSNTDSVSYTHLTLPTNREV